MQLAKVICALSWDLKQAVDRHEKCKMGLKFCLWKPLSQRSKLFFFKFKIHLETRCFLPPRKFKIWEERYKTILQFLVQCLTRLTQTLIRGLFHRKEEFLDALKTNIYRLTVTLQHKPIHYALPAVCKIGYIRMRSK